MDLYKETAETWNKIAELYQEKFMHLDLYNKTYDSFCDAINKTNASILELGCGPGNITKYIALKRPDFVIDAIDVAPNMIELAKINVPSANFSVMDSRQIDELDRKYDGIICGFCLPYLSASAIEKLILDAYNLLNPSGCLYLSFVEGDANKSGFKVGSSGDRVYFHYHNVQKLREWLIDSGFEAPQITRVNYKVSAESNEEHTIVLCRKN